MKEYPPSFSGSVLKLRKDGETVEVIPGLGGMSQVKLRMTRSDDTGVVLEFERNGEVLRNEYPFSNKLLLERITLPARKRAERQSLPSKLLRQAFPE